MSSLLVKTSDYLLDVLWPQIKTAFLPGTASNSSTSESSVSRYSSGSAALFSASARNLR